MSFACTRSAQVTADRGGPQPVARRLRLRDGRSVSISPLGPSLAASFQSFVRGLSPQGRAARFHMAIAELPPSLVTLLVNADQLRHVAWVAHEFGRPDAIVAEVRFVAAGDSAELAVAVADRWRHLGLARALLRRIARCASRAGLRRLWGHVRSDNEPMLSLARRAGFQSSPVPGDGGTLLIERELGPANSPLTSAGRRFAAWVAMRRRALSLFAAIVLPGGFLVLLAVSLTRRAAPAFRAITSRWQAALRRVSPRPCTGCP